MLSSKQEELQIIETKINNATYALQRVTSARLDAGMSEYCLLSIANSLIAIAKLLQLQAEQD